MSQNELLMLVTENGLLVTPAKKALFKVQTGYFLFYDTCVCKT